MHLAEHMHHARVLPQMNTHLQTYLSSIQIGRALAAIAVALQHSIRDADRYYPRYSGNELGFASDSTSWVELLGAGVDVFFVISGVVMVMSTWNGHGSIGGFLYRRITRIYPLYWLLTLSFMTVLVVAPGLFAQMRLEPVHATCSLFLIPCTDPNGEAIPYIYAGWTLTYELVFYGLFSLSLLVNARWSRLFVCIGLVLAYHSLYYTPLRQVPAIEHSASPIMLEFIFGLLLGYAYFHFNFNRKWALPLLIGGCTLLLLSHTGSWVEWPRFLRWGIPALLIVAGLMCANRSETGQGYIYRVFVYLGAASYAIYLFHFIALKLFYVIAGKLGVLALLPPMASVMLALMITIISSVMVHEVCEKPLTRVCKWLWQMRHERSSTIEKTT